MIAIAEFALIVGASVIITTFLLDKFQEEMAQLATQNQNQNQNK